ncbi:MAG: cell division protein FtsZ [Candidatus Methanoplasma sp.]|nr:cell division protein FtsZ [Candidatus Methanoplasma sp.]
MAKEVTMEPRVAVIGIGGAGCTVTGRFYDSLCDVDVIAINTDKKALDAVSADRKIYICRSVTKGEGTKGDKALGRKCACAHEEDIADALRGHDVAFIIAGFGGGTGTGAASVVADICNRMNMLTFAVAINPFSFESSRIGTAVEGLRALRAVCPATFVVENDRIFAAMPDSTMSCVLDAVNGSIVNFVIGMTGKLSDMVLSETDAVIMQSEKAQADATLSAFAAPFEYQVSQGRH